MRTYSLFTTVLMVVLFTSCQRNKLDVTAFNATTQANQKPAPPGSTTAHATCDYTITESNYTNSGWTKVFDEEFTNDLGNWNIWTGGAFNNELQYYNSNNLHLVNGVLQIEAKKETVSGATTPYDPTIKTFNYTSGRIECKSNISANATTPRVRMIARIKLPAGYGMWPAFWSYGDPWPTNGEIDCLEARGQEGTKYQTNYFYGRQANRNLVRNAVGYITADADLTACYHVYELEWAQDALTSYLDGNLVERKTSGGYIPDLFGKTEHITLNLAVGGDFFTNLNPALIQPSIMYIDYVKVFTSSN